MALGAASFHILLALAAGERHGAEISDEVKRMTTGEIRLMPGALYRYLKQMAIDGWIIESIRSGEGRRRYYRLTPRGKRVAQDEAHRLDSVVKVARSRRLLSET